MPINEHLSWTEVGAISTGEDNLVRHAFKGGQAEKVLLPGGFDLYKFHDFNTLAPPGATSISPWWSSVEPFRHDGGWEQRKKLASHLGVSIREFGRVTSAIKENWNSLKYLLVITLAHSTYAYFGGFAQMTRLDSAAASKRVTASTGGGAFRAEARGSTKNLPGGGTQFYIPNLSPSDVSSWRVESLLSM